MGRLRGLPVRPGTAYDCHSTYWEPREQPRESRPAPGGSPMKVMSSVQALVYDDPLPGREYDAPLDVRHCAAAPYCARPGCADRHTHWTEEHPEPDPLVAELLAARAERIAASGPVPGTLHPAITASLEAAGFTAHVTRQALDDSVIGTITPVSADG